MKKAIFINVFSREISEIEIQGRLEDYYKYIGCNTITRVSLPNSEDHDLILDDEGLLKDVTHLFSIDNPNEPQFSGNGIIMAVNFETGAWISPRITLDDIRKRVTFWQVFHTANKTFIIQMRRG